MVFDKGLCEFHARLALPAVCGVRGDDMHGCTVRQIGLTLGNNPVARLEAGNDLGRILGNQSGSDGNAGYGSARIRIYGEHILLVVVAGQDGLGRHGNRACAAVGIEGDGSKRADRRLGAGRQRNQQNVIQVVCALAAAGGMLTMPFIDSLETAETVTLAVSPTLMPVNTSSTTKPQPHRSRQ